MVDVRGDVLRPPHCTTPAAVKLYLKQICHAGGIPEVVFKTGPDPDLSVLGGGGSNWARACQTLWVLVGGGFWGAKPPDGKRFSV